ncbi:MAG TPA: hypothetical protein ENJ06_02495, partial [Phycisphaeraceae bacterium]|nr:hypothetical protein [Phycisphaeraceae bacterium]
MSMRIEMKKALSGAGLVALIAGSAVADLTTTDEQIASLEAQLREVKTQKAQEMRQGELNQLVNKVAEDASQRSFYSSGPASLVYNGAGKGFTLSDDGGNNTLNIKMYTQFRYNMNFQNDFDGTPNVDGTTEGFEFRRNRIIMAGKLQGDFGYFIQTDFGTGGVLGLLDTYFTWSPEPDVTVIAGQLKAPFMWETLVSASKQLTVDRSTVEAIFGAGRTQGVAVAYTGIENMKIVGAFSDGAGQANTDWNSDANEVAFTGRVDYVFAGEMDQFSDFTSNNSSDFGFRLGGAAHYQDGDVGDGATVTNGLKNSPNVFTWTVDAQAEWQGASLYAAIVGQHVETEGGASTTIDNYGYMAQGSFYMDDDTELFGRWEYIDLDGATTDPNIFTFGANYYVNGQANKLT